jgi:hypothetical protein
VCAKIKETTIMKIRRNKKKVLPSFCKEEKVKILGLEFNK